MLPTWCQRVRKRSAAIAHDGAAVLERYRRFMKHLVLQHIPSSQGLPSSSTVVPILIASFAVRLRVRSYVRFGSPLTSSRVTVLPGMTTLPPWPTQSIHHYITPYCSGGRTVPSPCVALRPESSDAQGRPHALLSRSHQRYFRLLPNNHIMHNE
jgi:hypothetical protein